MIDLRSDTLTVPDAGMREAMSAARVGDDVYAEDPTVEALQERVADMFGKEAALFVPSGTMGNQICLALHTSTGDEVICEADAHIRHYENAAASVVARVQLYPIATMAGYMEPHDIREAVRPNAYYYPKTALVAVENTHNRHGGTVLSLSELQNLRAVCDELQLPLHCDGARIWNAITSTRLTTSVVGAFFDTMSVCMSKAAGAPIGSLIVGSRTMIEQARRWRKMLGGGMRQVGVLAAACSFALDHIVPHLAADHTKAQTFADGILADGVVLERWKVQSNIVAFRIPTLADDVVIRHCADRGLRIATIKPGVFRAVFYHQVSQDDAVAAAEIVRDVLSLHHGNV